jgi:hypothetical protein
MFSSVTTLAARKALTGIYKALAEHYKVFKGPYKDLLAKELQ